MNKTCFFVACSIVLVGCNADNRLVLGCKGEVTTQYFSNPLELMNPGTTKPFDDSYIFENHSYKSQQCQVWNSNQIECEFKNVDGWSGKLQIDRNNSVMNMTRAKSSGVTGFDGNMVISFETFKGLCNKIDKPKL